MDASAACSVRKAHFDTLISSIQTSTGLVSLGAAYTRYILVVTWVEANIPLECLHPRAAAAAAQPPQPQPPRQAEPAKNAHSVTIAIGKTHVGIITGDKVPIHD